MVHLDIHALWLLIGLAFLAGVWAANRWPSRD